MKILFYINSPSSYQFDFFESLKNQKINFHVVYQNKEIKNFKWKLKKNNWSTYLDKKNLKYEFIELVKKINPNIIVLGGYNLKLNYLLKKFPDLKKIFWLERVNESNFIKSIIRRKILLNRLKDATAILAIGNKAKNFYLKFNKRVFNLPYSILPRSINNKKNVKSSIVNFLFVGQLIKRKGLEKLIKVLNDNTFIKARFTFVGDGPLKKKIKSITIKKNINHYNFLNKKKLDQVYDENDILILLSNFDGWGVVIVEAMSKKMAVISNKNVGASLDLIRHKYNGIIIDNEHQSIIHAINYCLNNFEIIKKWGTINRNIYKKSLSNSLNASNEFKKIITSLKK
jgi:glycosyltransferase involved in cell wall biosynthesis